MSGGRCASADEPTSRSTTIEGMTRSFIGHTNGLRNQENSTFTRDAGLAFQQHGLKPSLSVRAPDNLSLGRKFAFQECFDRGKENLRRLDMREVSGFLDEKQPRVRKTRGPCFG